MKLFLLLAPCVLASLGTTQTVHVVDSASGPGSTFTTIQAAIDFAAEGDIVLVRPGGLDETVLIDGKSLSIQGERDPGGLGTGIEQVLIENLSSSQSVVLRGFSVTSQFTVAFIELKNNQGSVWLEDLKTLTPAGPFLGNVFGGVLITDCAAVLISTCELAGTISFAQANPFEFRDSSVELYDCSLIGADDNLDPDDACVLVSSGTLGIYGSVVRGGSAELHCTHFGCGVPVEPGESGLHAVNATVVIQDSIVEAGFSYGSPAPPMVIEGGSLTELTSSERTHRVASPVREGESVDVSLIGEPNDKVWVYLSDRPAPAFIHQRFDGAFVIGSPYSVIFLGTLPGTGTLNLSFPLGELGPSVQGVVAFTQALFLDDAGQGFVFSEPTAVMLLDSSF